MSSAVGPDPSLDAAQLPALIADLANKSDLLWVTVPDRPVQPLWNVWHDNAVAVVTGGIEQKDPGLADGQTVELILRSRDNWARQVVVMATVVLLDPGSNAWAAAAAALHPKRWNPPDGENQPERWARESALWLLRPTAEVTEQPGAMSDDSHRAEVAETDATTITRRPFHAGRATKKRRRR
ncbi:MAG: hypothetical protein ABI720_06615 [Actinomycetes bacterium]